MTALALLLLNIIIKPVLKILFLPLNILTLGFFRWLINVAVIYFLTILLPYITVRSFEFPGLRYGDLYISSFHVSYFLSLIFASFLINLAVEVINWLID